MAGLYGHTGDQDHRAKMAALLSHRGNQPVQEASLQATGNTRPGLSLKTGVLKFSNRPLDQHSTGLHQEGQAIAAIAGQVFDQTGSELNPQRILSRFLTQGEEALKTLRGAFVAAITDGTTLYLIRDGAGRRTLFYSVWQGQLYFAVEQKAITQLPGFPRSISHDGLARYLTYSFLPGKETMMENVFELPPGTWLRWQDGQANLEYWFPFEKTTKVRPDDLPYWTSRIRDEVDAEIRQVLEREDKVGVFLSGGLDSSLITARVARLAGRQIPTYSIHFGKKYRNELPYARLIADRYHTDHHEVQVKPKGFLERLRKAIWHLDDPVGDPITVPNFELAHYAAPISPVIFNGEGGDPCFGGPKNIPMMLSQWYGIPNQESLSKQYLASYRRGYRHLEKLLHPDHYQALNQRKALESYIDHYLKASHPKAFLEKLLTINIRLKGAHLILPKVERMLGAWQCQPVSPLFTEKMLCSTIEMSPKFKLQNGIEKYILKEAFRNDLPEEIILRPKSGMRVPVHYWFRGEMRKYARKLLAPKKLKETGLFNPDTVQDILRYDYEKGLDRFGLLLWMLLTFEIWRQLFIEQEPL